MQGRVESMLDKFKKKIGITPGLVGHKLYDFDCHLTFNMFLH